MSFLSETIRYGGLEAIFTANLGFLALVITCLAWAGVLKKRWLGASVGLTVAMVCAGLSTIAFDFADLFMGLEQACSVSDETRTDAIFDALKRASCIMAWSFTFATINAIACGLSFARRPKAPKRP